MRKTISVIFILLISASAHASFWGQTVQATYYFPDVGTVFDQQQAVVGAGVEFTNFPTNDPRTNVDFSANNILITYNSDGAWTSAAFNGEFFDSLTPMPSIMAVTINGSTNMVGLDASRISFTENSVSINWNNLAFNTGTIVSLDVSFREQIQVPVPTMGPLALILLTLLIATLGVFGIRRKRISQ